MTDPLECPRPPPSGDQTVGSMLRHWESTTPAAPFLIVDDQDDSVTLDFATTADLGRSGAALLGSLGVRRGDRFAVVMGNSLEFFACWFGAALIGAVIVPTGPQCSVDELRYVFDHARCRVIICGAEQEPTARAACGPGQTVTVTGPDFSTHFQGPVPEPDAPIHPLDPLAVLYTSGTTSRPKGVVITHAAYLAAGQAVAGQLRIRPDDRWLVVLPLFHANAQYYCLMSALVTGASVAVTARFSASRWAAQARRHRATLASLFAAPLRMILAQPTTDQDDHTPLRATLFAQNLSPHQLTAFETRFDCPLIQLYGMTETVLPPLMNPLYGPRDNMTLGLPLPSSHLRVVDDTGTDVGPGQTGELLVGGEPGLTLMSGYLDDPAATAQALNDGWLRTGDLVQIRGDGFVVFKDRCKDMIKRSGENIASAEVERVVNDHPAVLESAAIGVPDPIRDQAIKVFAVPHPDAQVSAEELLAHCAHHLPRHKRPDRIELISALPRTSVGKIQKRLLHALDPQEGTCQPGERTSAPPTTSTN